MGVRAGGGARGGKAAGGGGGRGYTYLEESEKAVKVNAELWFEYSTNHKVYEKTVKTTEWIPKSQLVKGQPSRWITNKKAADMAEWNMPLSGKKVLAKSVKFTDKNGKLFTIPD